jgi:GT2 family glycosyltransferase
VSRVGLVIPVLNQFEKAVDCVWSAKGADAVYIEPAYRTGACLAKSWNDGIFEAGSDGCDVVVVANDDVLFGPETLLRLGCELIEHGRVLVFANDVSDTYLPDQVLRGKGYDVPLGNRAYRWACFAVNPWLFFGSLGEFDENFSPAWWEDVDMEYRAHLLGIPLHQTEVPYYHYGNATTNAIKTRDQKSQAYYERKWGSSLRNNAEKFRTPYDNPDLTPKDWVRE